MPSPCFSFDMFWSFREMSITCWSAKEWDDAVKEAQGQSSLCSLACVFLTDKRSGLGGHAENPEGCGNCFCQALYGNVDPAAYLSTVEEDLTEQELLFKKSDAEAMGQVLLIRQEDNDASWTARKKEALLKSAAKCKENRYRAPWGCRWFADWKENVDKAHQQGQKFHVFYFEGKVGCGKMAWEDRAGFDKNHIESQKKQLAKNIQQDQAKSKVQTETCFFCCCFGHFAPTRITRQPCRTSMMRRNCRRFAIARAWASRKPQKSHG